MSCVAPLGWTWLLVGAPIGFDPPSAAASPAATLTGAVVHNTPERTARENHDVLSTKQRHVEMSPKFGPV